MDLLLIVEVVVSILLIAAIQLQSEGSGLGPVWGSGSGSYHTRRGFEKLLFRATIALAIVFVVISLATLL